MGDFSFEFWTLWGWLAAGILLVIIEMMAPGLIFIWFGVAAIITGVVVGIAPDMAWQSQLILFTVLSVISLVAGRRWIKKNPSQTDDGSLNRRAEQYAGRSFTLTEPIVDGQGKLKVDDSIWKVRGPDMAAGARVKITGAEGTVLIVEAE